MKQDPWHLRLPHTQHYQWFKNLIDLHEMTNHWVKEIQADRPSHFISRGLSKEMSESLWMLDSLTEKNLESFLDETYPEEVLARLEHMVWAVQAWTVYWLQNNFKTENHESLDSVMEQISWRLGKACVESRWTPRVKMEKMDLRAVILAFNDSPFSGYPAGENFLIRRSIREEVQLELRMCPHRLPFKELKPAVDGLCRLQAHWMRGFAYGLNPRISMEHTIQAPRCTQHWYTSVPSS